MVMVTAIVIVLRVTVKEVLDMITFINSHSNRNSKDIGLDRDEELWNHTWRHAYAFRAGRMM